MRLTQSDTIVSDMASIDPTRLRQAMTLAGIGPAELARRVHCSTDYISHIAAGRRRLKRNPALRRRIADALDVPVDWIEGRYPKEAA